MLATVARRALITQHRGLLAEIVVDGGLVRSALQAAASAAAESEAAQKLAEPEESLESLDGERCEAGVYALVADAQALQHPAPEHVDTAGRVGAASAAKSPGGLPTGASPSSPRHGLARSGGCAAHPISLATMLNF